MNEIEKKLALKARPKIFLEKARFWHDLSRNPNYPEVPSLSDEQVFEIMGDSSWTQDPPDGWSREQLAMFLRGYLYGMNITYGNCSSWLLGEGTFLQDLINGK